MPDEENKTKEDDNEDTDELDEEPEDTPSLSPDISKQIVEGIGYLGGLIEELTAILSETFTSFQEKMDRMNITLDEIKKLKSEQMSTIAQDTEKPHEKKPEHRSTLSETAQKIKAQAEKKGNDDEPKHPGRGKYPRHPKKGSSAGERPQGSDGGTVTTPEQSHDKSPEPDMGSMSPDNQGEAKPE
jgi:uncharacterized phage infection (PIP) family protein YhgE